MNAPAQDPGEFDRGAQEDPDSGVLGMYRVFADNATKVPKS